MSKEYTWIHRMDCHIGAFVVLTKQEPAQVVYFKETYFTPSKHYKWNIQKNTNESLETATLKELRSLFFID